VVGLSRANHGISAAGPTLLAGIGAVMIGTIEVTLREHRSGFRSHALILSLLPVVLFHSGVVLIVAAFTTVPRAVNFGLLPVDVLLFALLFKLLRARFEDARRERRFAARR
jgi:cytochrome c biogenesis factor